MSSRQSIFGWSSVSSEDVSVEVTSAEVVDSPSEVSSDSTAPVGSSWVASSAIPLPQGNKKTALPQSVERAALWPYWITESLAYRLCTVNSKTSSRLTL